MATWYDLTFVYKQLLTYQQMTKFDGNLDALAEGAAGTPKLQTAAVDDNQITVDKIDNDIDATGIGFDADKLDGKHLAEISGNIGSGIYVGDATVDKAIAHGLGVIPKIVLIVASTGDFYAMHFDNNSIWWQHQGGGSSLVINANKTTTNFYVGNAADYGISANVNLIGYRWVAIG